MRAEQRRHHWVPFAWISAVTWHGGVHADVGGDVAMGLVGFCPGLGMVDGIRMGRSEGGGIGRHSCGDVAQGMGCNGRVRLSVGG